MSRGRKTYKERRSEGDIEKHMTWTPTRLAEVPSINITLLHTAMKSLMLN